MTEAPSTAFVPTSLPFDQWPSAHRAAWLRALNKGSLFEEASAATKWKEATIKLNRDNYGFWLSWLIFLKLDIAETQPQDLVTQSNISGFIDALKIINEGYTPYTRISCLHNAMLVLAPEQRGYDWSWLNNAAKHLRGYAKSKGKKEEALRPVTDLARLGLTLMQRAKKQTQGMSADRLRLTELKRAELFRDGLIITFLAHRLLRIDNYTHLEIGKSIHIFEASASVFIEGSETKGDKIIEHPFPKKLFSYLNYYLTKIRPFLCARTQESRPQNLAALWINRFGKPLAEQSLRKAVNRRTKAAFGKAHSVHWFRDAGATTLISQEPSLALLAARMLSHSGPQIIEKHYDHTPRSLGVKRYAKELSKIRRGRMKGEKINKIQQQHLKQTSDP